ncbi:hypothetical protein CWB99_22775 [Pseudoalteromonas rubra]|uniref:Uncharacterized protein n=1 Tax=Pseudoalteromonas rubra TaxID=43658 RepID=A0A5S3WGE8_9GAMM|nr:hypothetical protein [Pseudoalteromonas rubra]TMP24026.1 hypothetical protein CWB99_22775 [Pseudoalteromonas rubra]TMP35917.1 hypothetical protein CWC00_03320 [Pseudoalteromonas rubra]
MRSWVVAIVVSVASHLGLLWLLAQHRAFVSTIPSTKSIKTYLVVEQPKKSTPMVALEPDTKEPEPAISTKEPAEQLVVPKEPPASVTAATVSSSKPVAENKATETVQSQQQIEASGNTNKDKPYKHIDPALGLSRLRLQQQQLNQQIAGDAPTGQPQPQRLGVPKSHHLRNQTLRQVESQNQIFTEYREGDRCYKEVQGDPNNPPPEGFAKNWLTMSSTCDKNAITDAYDAAMGKWLDKNR